MICYNQCLSQSTFADVGADAGPAVPDPLTLIQSVTEGHLSQLHLRPRVVQDLPAPLEGADEGFTLELSFGRHIKPGETKQVRVSPVLQTCLQIQVKSFKMCLYSFVEQNNVCKKKTRQVTT